MMLVGSPGFGLCRMNEVDIFGGRRDEIAEVDRRGEKSVEQIKGEGAVKQHGRGEEHGFDLCAGVH